MKKWLMLIPLLLSACTTVGSAPVEEVVLPIFTLRDHGPAPELTNETWLNVGAPLRLADLRGKVVAIDMWTFD
ncbi:MAG: hypothetical protein RIR73_504 [Chloroflexota bacterium]